MKKMTLLVAAAAAMFTSCSKTDNVENESPKTPIVFKHASVVKASMTQPFTVKAYKSAASIADWAVAPYFTEACGSNGAITSGTTYYYDGVSFYNFVGYAPAADASITASTDPASPSVSFTTPANADVDLLAAKATEVTGTTENAVSLLFKHALTKVKFSVLTTTPDAKIVVTGISFKALPTNTLDLTTGSATMSAANATGSAITLTINNLTTALTATASSIATEFLVVPQDLTGVGEIVVTYTVDGVTSTPKTLTLTNTLVSNGVVNYKITIDANAVSFAPEEDVWGSETEI